ncbi:CAP domain-containing protein [Thiolapillus sp.]|uniref:CAP domain-containing protein n=3 Tax=Thiolapillus sp. TaxID=2017437 RepID=UPI0025D503F9|nr:CAP domain-containing protein [Thiolapillus sp.]
MYLSQANGDYGQQVVELVNQERWDNGQLAPLKKNSALDAAAMAHSRGMAYRDFFDHCDLDNKTTPWDRMRQAGYSFHAAGENIAAGQGDPADVMNSPGHRANILSNNFREMGVGYVLQSDDRNNIRQDSNGDCAADRAGSGPYYRYWTQDFGRSGVYPLVIEREKDETASPRVELYVYGQGFAREMRFQNENGSWSSWEAYAENRMWDLSAGAGSKRVSVQIRNGSAVAAASDEILLIAGCSAMNQDHYLQLAACNTLSAGNGGFRVVAGETSFHAPRIELQPRFSVADNAVFSVTSGVPQ